jgi:hypothetical protein
MSTRICLGVFVVFAALTQGVACGSSSSSAPAAGSAAKTDFETKVFPIMAPCNTCHSDGTSGAPRYFTTTAEGTYTAIEGTSGLIAAPKVSPLMQHGIHTGPALTDDQKTAISAWLDEEVKARHLVEGPSQPTNLQDALKGFVACLDWKLFEQRQMGEIYKTVANTGAGNATCDSCHSTGENSLLLNPDHAKTFLGFKDPAMRDVQRLVVGTVDQNNAFAGLQPARRLIDKGNEPAGIQRAPHPKYGLSQEMVDNVDHFVGETLYRQRQGLCDPKIVTEPPPPDAGVDARAGNGNP